MRLNLPDDGEDRKAHALALAAAGFHVLPVQRGEKRPDKLLAPSGFKDASRDPEKIGGWFAVKPGVGIGVACGANYELLVLDVDVKNGSRGMQTLQALECHEPTLTADTPSGGLHLYFQHPRQVLTARLDGIDVKGGDGGGYVVCPPSTLANGVYAWRDPDMPVLALPPHVLEQLRAGVASNGAASNGGKRKASPVDVLRTPHGRRHEKLIELGALWRGKGLAADEVETLLWSHAERYFDPPFRRDSAADVREIEAVVGWFGKKQAPAGGTLLVLSTPELLTHADAVAPPFLIDPLLPEAGSMMIYGPTGSGKSHLALSLALALSRGQPLLDWSTTAAPVLFCDGEMSLAELKARLLQYLRGEPPPENLHWAAARAQQGEMPNLADPEAQAHYLAAIETSDARVVVFDNLSCLRTTDAVLPENSVEAWQPVAGFIRRLNVLGVAVILVHHSAKSGTQRGSSAHTAIVDTVVRIRPPGEGQADPRAELDVFIEFEKHRYFGGDAAAEVRAKVIGDADGYAAWERCDTDALVDDVVRLRRAGKSIREIAAALQRSKNGIQKAIERAKARGLLPLGGAE